MSWPVSQEFFILGQLVGRTQFILVVNCQLIVPCMIPSSMHERTSTIVYSQSKPTIKRTIAIASSSISDHLASLAAGY